MALGSFSATVFGASQQVFFSGRGGAFGENCMRCKKKKKNEPNDFAVALLIK